jgi:hypothetical protein
LHRCIGRTLHNCFIEANRPVPRFIVLDQPSQASFPRERETGGDLTELNDMDRQNTRKLYKRMADFADDWFQDPLSKHDAVGEPHPERAD